MSSVEWSHCWTALVARWLLVARQMRQANTFHRRCLSMWNCRTQSWKMRSVVRDVVYCDLTASMSVDSEAHVYVVFPVHCCLVTGPPGQHCPKIMKPPQSLPLQMVECLLHAQPDSVANHVNDRSISDRYALTWLDTETGWARSKRSAICSGKLISGYMIFIRREWV